MDIDISLAIIAGLFSSGGIVALLVAIFQHKEKVKSIELERKKLDIEREKSQQSLREKELEYQAKLNEQQIKLERIIRKQIPLEHHPIFVTMDELEQYFLKTFTLPDYGRTLIIREFIVSKIRVWRTVIRKYVVEGQSCIEECGSAKRETCNKSVNSFRNMLNEGMREYEKLWDTNFKTDVTGEKQYDQESFETMKVFIPIFHQWHSSREEVVRIASSEIPNAGLNYDCHGDWWDVLYVYLFSFVQMKYDATNAMHAINGDLTGKKFLDIEIGELPHKNKVFEVM